MSSPVPWWQKSAPPAPRAATVDLDDAVIDLTSDAAPSSSLGATSAPLPGSNSTYSSRATSDDKVCHVCMMHDIVSDENDQRHSHELVSPYYSLVV